MAKQAALKFVVFLGTVRENNFGSRAAKFIVNKIQAKGHTVTLLDPAELNLPLLKKAYHHYEDGEEIPKVLKDTNKIIEDADAYIVLVAEYNHSLPPALTNVMDHFPPQSYAHRPSGIVCYSAGAYGGVRAAMQARAFLGELNTPSVGYIFSIPKIYQVLTPDGTTVDKDDDYWDRGAGRLIQELEWYGVALKNQRDSAGLP